jgi:hypothetical protein
MHSKISLSPRKPWKFHTETKRKHRYLCIVVAVDNKAELNIFFTASNCDFKVKSENIISATLQMGMNHRVKSVDKAVMNRTLGEVRDSEKDNGSNNLGYTLIM